jgi:hypothetical protein
MCKALVASGLKGHNLDIDRFKNTTTMNSLSCSQGSGRLAWVWFFINFLKAEGEPLKDGNETRELKLLYSQAIVSFENVKVDARKSFRPEPEGS